MNKVKKIMEGAYNINSNPLVMCFSSAFDDAAQWERYADSGKGVSIIINPSNLKKWSFCNKLSLFEVRYIGNIKYFHKANSEVVNTLRLIEEGKPLCYDMTPQQAIENIIWKSAFIKHRSFHSEKEYRLANLNNTLNSECCFFTKRGLLTRYVDIKIDGANEKGLKAPTFNEIITGVVIGPKSRHVPKDIMEIGQYFGCAWGKKDIFKSVSPLE